MSSFILQSFTGISDREDKGHSGAFKHGSGLDVRRKRDTLKAGQALATDLAEGDVMTAGVVDVVTSSDGNSYWGLSNGRILKRTSAGSWSLVYTDTDNVLRGIAEWGNDQGEYGIYWAGSTKLHRKPIPGLSDWSDVDDDTAGDPNQTYPKSNLTDTPNHMMRVVNGALLINNANTLAMVGYDESYTNNALQLIPGNLAQVLLDDGIYAKIGANRSDNREESWLYAWDLIALNYNDRDSIPIADINSIIKTEITMIQVGDDGMIYFLGDASKLPIISIPGGGQTEPAGVDSDVGLALFGVYGGTYPGVWSYGRRWKNSDFVLNYEYPLTCDAIYAVKKVGSDILIAYKSGSNYGVKKVDTANKVASATYESLDLKLPPEFQRLAELSPIQVICAPLPAGCSIEIWRKLDKNDSTGWVQCNLQGGATSLSTTNATEGIFLVGDKARILEVKAVLNCSGNNSPEIIRIQPFFN